MDGLYDTDEDTAPLDADFDDVASRAAKEAEAREDKDGDE